MDLSLSDLLTCPRCGPAHGLVLLPAALRGRRVTAGVLGCPNCRERYPIAREIADLRGPGAAPTEPADPTERGARAERAGPAADGGADAGDAEATLRLAALLGLEGAAGVVGLAGAAAAYGSELARLLEGVEVVALAGIASAFPAGDVSRLLVTGPLPFRDGALAGIALTGPATAWWEEGVRVVRAGSRVLLEPAPPALRASAEAEGMEVVLAADETLVVARRP
jgi:uncharacterized protein YbaR (Trm112 family)